MTSPTPSILARALDSIDGYRQLSDAIDAAESHVRELPPPPADPAAEIAAEVREAVVAGKPVPADLGRRILDAEDAARARQAEARLIGVRAGGRGHGLIGRLMVERDALVRAGADDALGFLADELSHLLGQVVEADRVLGSIRSADQALTADAEVGAAWRVLTEAVDAYDAIRAAQAEALVAGGFERGRVRPDVEDAGIHRDADTVDPRWRARIEGEEPTPNDAVLAARSPWPSPRPTRGAGWWPTDDRPNFLRWLAVSDDVRPWVPTRSQLASQLAALEAAVTDAAVARRGPAGPSAERALVAAGVASRARSRH
jgi:hypothetical protein